MEKTENVKKFKKERLLVTILASIIAPFIVFVAVPMIIFGNNIDEFLFNWSDFIPICLGFAILLSAIIFFAIFFLPEKAYKICLHILVAVDLLVFMQSTYLNGKLTLSGDAVINGNILLSVLDLLFWVLIIAAAVVLALLKDKKKYIKTGALILCVVVLSAQMISTIVPVISNKKYFQTRAARTGQKTEYVPQNSTYKNLENYSTSSNIYYFLIDTFDAKYAETAYEYDENIYNKLTGFTWYKDNITLYGHTFPSIVYSLTGFEHSCDYNREPYLDAAYEADNYLKELKDAGYSINVYTDSYHSYSTNGLPGYIDNADDVKYKLNSKFTLFKHILRLGVYVSAPTLLKSVVGRLSTDTFKWCFSYKTDDGKSGYSTYNVDLLEKTVKEMEFVGKTEKQFTYLHMNGTHDPITEKDQSKEESSTGQLKRHLEIIDVFLQNLKDKGLYDEATIIITGDHPSGYDTFTEIKETRQVGLFFKPSQTETESKEPLKTSMAKVEQKNIMPSIFHSIGVQSAIATQKGDTPLHLTDSADRKHIWHTYYCDVTEYVYSIRGVGSDLSNWHLVSEKKYNKRVTD